MIFGKRLTASAGLALLAGLSLSPGLTPLYAQDAAATEEVVVTGSRIRQDPLEEAGPVLTLSAEDLERSGLTSLGDFLQRLSSSGSALNTRFNSSGNFGFPPDGSGVGAGSAQVDLRHLGSKRTLVLVDGVRWVNESSASGVGAATDLNTIPISIIDRIEVLEDGASAIYGSDAIAGVVNVITKRNFQGFEVSAYTGGYLSENDGETTEFSLSMGSTSDDMNVFMNIGYVDQKKVSAADRPIASTPIPFITDGSGGSSGTPQGRFFFVHPTLMDPNGNSLNVDCTSNPGSGSSGIPAFSLASPCGFSGFSQTGVDDDNNPVYAAQFDNVTDDFNPFDTSDRFNFSPFNLVATPNERLSIYGQADYKLSDSVSFYLKGLYNNRKSTNQAAPEPIFIGPDAGNGNVLDTVSIDVTNPYNPFGITLNADPTAGDVNFVFAGRRPLEGGPRIFNQDVNTFYVSGGLVGDFEMNGRNFFWDVNALWSENKADQVKFGGYNAAKIKQALGPLADCVAPCVPLNYTGGQGPNGDGTITPAMLNYISFVQKDSSEQELVDISANITGDIATLPAGTFAFAAGIEHREQDGSFRPDAIVVAGENAGIPAQPTSGGFDVDEMYAEFNLPLIAGKPGIDLLEVSAAIRNSDYSTFGSETTTKFGVRWRPTDQVLFRANVAEGFRAPSIGELFGSETRFDQTLDDPCSDMLAIAGASNGGRDTAQSQAIVDSCVGLGVPANGSYTQFNPQISVVTGGNKNLRPETADSMTLSAVYSPSWVDNLNWAERIDFEVLYYEHELDGAITAIDAELQLNSCVNSGDPAFCNSISRTPNGVINRFQNTLTNIGGIETDGFDVNITYFGPDTDWGRFNVTWFNTFLGEYAEIVPTTDGFTRNSFIGLENGDPERAFPEWKSTLIVDWLRNEWSGSWSMRFIDEVTETCPDSILGFGVCSDSANAMNTLDATTYHDLQFGYTPDALDGNFQVSLGIQNLFDQDPPTCFSCALNGFDATQYALPGRFWYLRANWRRE